MAAKDKTDETPNPSVTLTLAELKDLLGGASANALNAETLEAILLRTAQVTASSMQKALKPENPHHPGVSVYSYPEGDQAKPKPTLPFELLWKGFPISMFPETTTWYELEQFAQIKPGRYTVSRRDGSPMKVEATAVMGPDGITVEKMVVDFEADRDTRPMVSPPFIMAYQMNHADEDRQETFVEATSQLLRIMLEDRKAKERALTAA